MRAQVARKRAVTMPLTPRIRARRRRRPGKPARPERRLAQEKGSMRAARSRKRRQPARPMPNRQRQPELVRQQQPRLVAKANTVAARAAQPERLLPKRERAWHHQRACLHKLAAAKVSMVKVRPRRLALPLQPLRAHRYRQARQHRQRQALRQAQVSLRAHQLRQARREQLQLRLAPLQLAAQR